MQCRRDQSIQYQHPIYKAQRQISNTKHNGLHSIQTAEIRKRNVMIQNSSLKQVKVLALDNLGK